MYLTDNIAYSEHTSHFHTQNHKHINCATASSFKHNPGTFSTSAPNSTSPRSSPRDDSADESFPATCPFHTQPPYNTVRCWRVALLPGLGWTGKWSPVLQVPNKEPGACLPCLAGVWRLCAGCLLPFALHQHRKVA